MEFLTVQTAAERAGVSVNAIYYSIGQGKLTSHSQYGKLLVDASELERYKPRAHPNRSKSARQRVLAGRGLLEGHRGSVDAFLADKRQDKAYER